MEPIYNNAELLKFYRMQYYFPVMFYLPKDAYKTNEILKFNIQVRIDVLKLKPKNSTVTHAHDTIKQLQDYLFLLYCDIEELPLYQEKIFDILVKWRFETGK